MRCKRCGSETKFRRVPHTVLVADVELAGELVKEVCPRCAQEELTVEELSRFELRAAAVLVQHGVCTGAAARFARRVLRMSPFELAALFDIDAGAVMRWEMGKEPADRRVFALLGELILAKLEGRRPNPMERFQLLAQPDRKMPKKLALGSPTQYGKQSATCADVRAAPHGMLAELIQGALYVHPHSPDVVRRLVDYVSAVCCSADWVLLDQVELRVPGPIGSNMLAWDMVVPDLCGWQAQRFTESAQARSSFVAPDWVCEVLLPVTASYKRSTKREAYLVAEVEYLWLIDPFAQTIEVFQRHGLPAMMPAKWVLLGTYCDEARMAPFPSVDFDLPRFWGLL